MKEKLQTMFGDDRAVSPVVGVALLIAMTVILAAILAAVVLGLGSNPAESPQATFDFDQEGTTLIITHNGGDVLEGDEITIQVNGEDEMELAQDWSVGETREITEVGEGDTVRIVWEDSDSSTTSTLTTYEVS